MKQIFKRQKFIFAWLALLIVVVAFAYIRVTASDAPLFNSVIFNPELDISRFGSYRLEADVSRFPTSQTAVAQIYGLNGDGGPYWDYYADGRVASNDVTKSLNYDVTTGKWLSGSIYPDSIYPEIYFSPSATTWNNQPSDVIVRRNNYQLLHLDNPFTPTGEMSFWIEVNAYRESAVNSANLQVYLVEAGHDQTYFQEDWRGKTGVELVGAITKDALANHAHSPQSSHHLVALATNADGTVGQKHLNIAGDFWVILYSTSPSNARGYSLRYHDSNICSTDRWYSGSQTGWTISQQTGCPDSHIHIARRSTTGGIKDGVQIVASASSEGETGTKTVNLYYNELPNMPPNATVFRQPSLGSSHAGELDIVWDAASDPNNDTLTYSVYILDSNLSQIGGALVENTASTSLSIPTQNYPNGEYYLKGVVCDQGVPGNDPPGPPLCTEFSMPRTFTINNGTPIYSLSDISISSTNPNQGYVKEGETVTLSFTSTGVIEAPLVSFYTSGSVPNNPVSITSTDGIHWTASYVVSDQAPRGEISFEIHSAVLGDDYYETTDGTKLFVDIYKPIRVSNVPANVPDGVATDTNLSLVLDEEIVAREGKYLSIVNTGTDHVVERIPVKNDARVSVSGATITINPASDLVTGTRYHVLVDAGSFVDLAGNMFDGILSKSDWSFGVGDLTAPSLSSVHISSSHADAAMAVTGDTITLSFITSEEISSPEVAFSIGDRLLTASPTITSPATNSWQAVYTVQQADGEGTLLFSIDYRDLAGNAGRRVTTSSDGSAVVIGAQLSGTPAVSPGADTNSELQSTITTSTHAEETSETEPEVTTGDSPRLFKMKVYIVNRLKPIEGVRVELHSSPRVTQTDDNGIAEFTGVEPGEHEIHVHIFGKVFKRSINVGSEGEEEYMVRVDVAQDDCTSYLWLYIVLVGALLLFVGYKIWRSAHLKTK